MDKEDVATKRNEIVPFAEMWMDLETVIQGEVNQKKKSIIKYCLYVKSRKMIQINLFAKQKQRHRCREQTYGHNRGREKWNELGNWD